MAPSLLVAQSPPAPPLPVATGASRGAMLQTPSRHRVAANGLLDSQETTVMLPLSAGISMVSIPLRTNSQVLSDLLPNLPEGSRVWRWDAPSQQFVEGFDQELPLGEGLFLYVPTPTVVTITGENNPSSEMPVELSNGWNLIGVPYQIPMQRSSQVAYVQSVGTSLDDAIAQGVISDAIYSFDTAGHFELVGEGDMFQPGRAYWVYSNGVDLLELSPTLLGIPDRFDRWMVAEKIGTIALNWAASYLIGQISPDPNQAVLDKLGEIDKQIKDINSRMDSLDAQFKATQLQISMVEQAILQTVKEVNLNAVRDNVSAHYDDANAPNQSYMYFEENAQTASGRARITDKNRTDFANNVLNQWNFLKDFNTVRSAIVPDSGDGVLDHFANQIVLQQARDSNGTPIAKGTLLDRYKSMELYFNRLVSLQYKIMLLLTNSWTLQANGDPTQADNWRRTTYADAIRAETLRFRNAGEKIIAASLRVATTTTEAPVSVPPEVGDTIVPSLDFGVMNLINQPGVRVRVFVARYLNEPDTYTIVERNNRLSIPVPSADSGLWTALPAGSSYDAWRVRNNPAAFATDSTPEFYFDNYWIMYAFTLPTTTAFGTYDLKLVDKWGITDDNDTPALYGYRSLRVGNVDDSNQPSANGKLFGTVILVKRAAARTMLRIYNDGKSQYWNYCTGKVSLGKDNDVFVVNGNCLNGWAGYLRAVPFYFSGPQESAPGDFTLGLRTQMAKCNVSDSLCVSAYSFGQVQLLDNDQNVVEIHRYDTNSQVSYPKAITWQKSHTYKFQMRLVHSSTSNATGSVIWRGPLLLRFNQ
ncbi:MAG TPA: hypothetical protein VJ853_01465 [Thermoanaerobaculia bacterium]|nr:hypothetical protein [Thermoanaerobaculia bacterium]